MRNSYNLFDNVGLVKIVQVSCGPYHAAAITALGTLLTWGSNFEFQLGVNTASNTGVPGDEKAANQKQGALSGTSALRLKRMKQFFSEPLEEGGSKRLPGAGADVEVTRPVVVLFPIADGEKQVYARQVSCGATHTLLLDQSGDAWSWGSGRDGILGHHRSQSVVPMPRKITSFKVGSAAEVGEEKIVKVVAGEYNSGVVVNGRGDGKQLYLWGSGENGQLGEC